MAFNGNGTPHNQTTHEYQGGNFKAFFEQWIEVQRVLLHELKAISKSPPDETTVRGVLDRVMNHYEHYYREKGRAARHNAFAMLNPTWTSKFEGTHLWVGGWRPTMAVQLLYSKSSIQLFDQLKDLLDGDTCDLPELSAEQLEEAEKLQKKTLVEEKFITEKHANIQKLFPDHQTVVLSELVTELMNEEYGDYPEGYDREAVSMMGSTEMVFMRVLLMADNLCLKTLKAIVQLLSIKQELQFLATAAAFHIRIYEWGIKYDEKKLLED